MDFITKLPLSNNFDSILVVVDRFSKMTHFSPCSENAKNLAKLFIEKFLNGHEDQSHAIVIFMTITSERTKNSVPAFPFLANSSSIVIIDLSLTVMIRLRSKYYLRLSTIAYITKETIIKTQPCLLCLPSLYTLFSC